MRSTTGGRFALVAAAAVGALLCGPARADYLYTLKDLGTLGGNLSQGNAVNDAGQVAGASITAGNTALHAFLSGPGGGPLQDLGTLGGRLSRGNGVNDAGRAVGFSDTADGAEHAMLYSGGRMLDLNDLISPGSGFTLVDATGISDTGYITGWGTASDGSTHAFLLTPVPEPSGLVLVVTGAAGLLACGAWGRRPGL